MSEAISTVKVNLGKDSYSVFIGDGVRKKLPEHLPETAEKVAIITQANIGWQVETGIEQKVFHIPDSEEAKTMAVAEGLCRELSDWGLSRGDVIVGVGGGVVTDVAGFVAAVYHRGVAVLHVATTLLCQVDAAIGGKTGVNLPEGKNLVGAFWQPKAVFCDTETLETLPEREFRGGCGEVAKYELLGAAELWRGEQQAPSLSEMSLTERIAACVNYKAEIVSADEREGGKRALLNYGHTLAHALEIVGDFSLTHGEAVGIGLVYAAEVAHLLGRISTDRVAEHRRLVSSYGLATSLSEAFPESSVPTADELLPLFGRDKKAVGAITFILEGESGYEAVKGISEDVLRQALKEIAS